MKADFHMHTVFCDGINTPEEMVQAAIAGGFSAIGFSGHGFTDYDLEYCMKDTDGYIAEIRRLQERYAGRLHICLGAEEDAFAPVDRSRFDYIIGSAHYLRVAGKYYPVDSGQACIDAGLKLFDGSAEELARAYFGPFCDYIETRKPDIIGHFDLITKYEQVGECHFLHDQGYRRVAKEFAARAARSGCLFEVNTGAMARGLRTAPYPSEELLAELNRAGARLILSSDSHSVQTLGFRFEEAKALLRQVGFRQLYTINGDTFVPYDI